MESSSSEDIVYLKSGLFDRLSTDLIAENGYFDPISLLNTEPHLFENEFCFLLSVHLAKRLYLEMDIDRYIIEETVRENGSILYNRRWF